jgi:hypothetical protein
VTNNIHPKTRSKFLNYSSKNYSDLTSIIKSVISNYVGVFVPLSLVNGKREREKAIDSTSTLRLNLFSEENNTTKNTNKS